MPRFQRARKVNILMNVSGVSMSNALAAQATEMKAGGVGSQIAIAVLKQLQEQQRQQAAALIEMIQSSPAAVSDGSVSIWMLTYDTNYIPGSMRYYDSYLDKVYLSLYPALPGASSPGSPSPLSRP